jgi:hypothetical protein
MKFYRLFSTFLAIIVLACLFGVQGQIQVAPSTTAPSATQNPAQFSQYYTMTSGPAPSNPIGAPQQFEIVGMPSTVYLGEQMQSVPYSQYQSSPTYTGANSLWIKGATTWTQYAVVPQGATVSLLAISPAGGSGFLASDGQTDSNNYVFYPSSLLTFYAGTIGRHTLSFAINGQSSNQVVLDVVVGTYTQPSTNPENYPENYPENDPGYYPGDYCNAGYHIDEYGYCVPDQVQCGAGTHLENGICVPDQVQCGAGTHLENGICVPDQAQCKAGYHLENGICVPDQAQCKAGYHLENGICVPDQAQCKAGYHLENGICVPDQAQCGTGYHLENGVCVFGQVQVQCAAGYHLENGICVPDQVNPSGGHSGEIRGEETNTSGNQGGDTGTGGNPGNAPSITPVNPSTNVPSTNPSGGLSGEIRGVETHTSGNQGGDNNQCDTGYHLENSICVPDQAQCGTGYHLENGICVFDK